MKINKGQKYAITGTFFGEDSMPKMATFFWEAPQIKIRQVPCHNWHHFLGRPPNNNKAL